MADKESPNGAESEADFRAERRTNRRKSAAGLLVLALVVAALLLFVITSLSDPHTFSLRGTPPTAPDPDAEKVTTLLVPPPRPAPRQEDSPYAIGRQTVIVITDEEAGTGRFSAGVGYVLSDGLVVTVGHVISAIKGAEKLPVTLKCSGVVSMGTVMLLDRLREVAAISAPACHGQTLAFDTRPLVIGQVLHVSGFDLVPGESARWFTEEANVQMTALTTALPKPKSNDESLLEFRRLYGEMQKRRIRPFFAFSGAYQRGNSGSPLFGDDGRIVGHMSAANGSSMALAVPAATIVEALKRGGILY